MHNCDDIIIKRKKKKKVEERRDNEPVPDLTTISGQVNIIKCPIFVDASNIENRRSNPRAQTCCVRSTSSINFICLHYTGGWPKKNYNPVNTAEHHISKGYNGAQYNYIVEEGGKIYHMRADNCSGAANPSARNCIAICYHGGAVGTRRNPKTHKLEVVGGDTRTPQQKASLLSLFKYLMKKYPSIQTIRGHKECAGASTQCPGFYVTKDPVYKAINNSPSTFRR